MGGVVIVTGAGRGIGRAHARALAEAGWSVVVNDLGVAADGSAPASGPADEVVTEIGAAGGQAVADHGDISTEAGATALVATALDRFGRLDAVVNNAGILRSGLILRTTVADWRAVLEVHVLGTMLVTQAAARHWRDLAKGDPARLPDARIVNTTSTAGLYGFVGEPAYSAAKAAIAGFTLTAAAELGRYGVKVNAIAPAAATRLTAWAGDQLPRPELVSPIVIWLLSDFAASVTGRIFEVGGGEIRLVEGWRAGRTIPHGAHADAATIDALIGPELAMSTAPVPAFVPGEQEA